MRTALLIVLLALAKYTAAAQSSDAVTQSMVRHDNWRVTLTLFRSPGTGLQISKGHFAAFIGHYPTVIEREGSQGSTHFLRLGVAYYAAPSRSSTPYVSMSFAPSLSDGWPASGIADAGMRHHFGNRISGQFGAAVLYAPGIRETRVNPTVGMGVRF